MGAPNTTVCFDGSGYQVNHRPQNTMSGIFSRRNSQSRNRTGTFSLR